jgi:competence protein ComEC
MKLRIVFSRRKLRAVCVAKVKGRLNPFTAETQKTPKWRRMRLAPCLGLLVSWLLLAACAHATPRTLDIYFIDTEGGAATLIVTPAGQSLLIDTGFPGDRDSARIARVAQEAGLKQIDHCLITHWHRDHVGGVPTLAKLISIVNYYDHGLPEKVAEDMQAEFIDAYKKTTGGKSIALKAGDWIKLKRSSLPLNVRVVASDGLVLGEKPGAAEIQPCGPDFKSKDPDKSDNQKSVGVLLTFGRFRFFDGGDLTWNIENRLACPRNITGVVDVYQVDHHGLDSSNNPVFVNALNPRVAIIDQGARKGGEAQTFATLKALKEIEAIYQLHRNVRTADKDNTMAGYIANEEEACQGNLIKLSVAPDSRTYTVSIPAKQISRTYWTR